MKHSISKKIFGGLTALKVLVGTLSSFSLVSYGMAPATAAPAANNSPLLSQSAPSQASINKLTALIKQNAQGNITAGNINVALAEALAATQGTTVPMLAAAINQLGLAPETLQNAVSFAAQHFGIEQSDIVGAMITDTYMSQGRNAAMRQQAALRSVVGSSVVDRAQANMPSALLSDASDLAQIQPAAGGVYEG